MVRRRPPHLRGDPAECDPVAAVRDGVDGEALRGQPRGQGDDVLRSDAEAVGEFLGSQPFVIVGRARGPPARPVTGRGRPAALAVGRNSSHALHHGVARQLPGRLAPACPGVQRPLQAHRTGLSTGRTIRFCCGAWPKASELRKKVRANAANVDLTTSFDAIGFSGWNWLINRTSEYLAKAIGSTFIGNSPKGLRKFP